MEKKNLFSGYTHPIVIGGVGGSGTRLIAQCLNELGFFMGHDLNKANDNLWFPFLFKRAEILTASEEEFNELVEILLKGMTGSGEFTNKQIDLINDLASRGREQHPLNWQKERAHTLLSKRPEMQPNAKWGWKAPNSHIVLDRLKKYFCNMKYIHVVRNGLDMAHSHNQNQLSLWGRHFLGGDFDISPYYSLKYWCIIHRRVLDIGKSMGADFLFLNYDNFCFNPEAGITALCAFLGLDSASMPKNSLLKLVNPARSIGRFKQHGIEIFDEKDVAYVNELGFDTDANEKITSP
ncbi:MAG: sulfotransferase [Gammaproteobacteria bacterium]|nr:sulfotransferase [Gammaproteobacteria bacterium]